jgi:hypothetical protein
MFLLTALKISYILDPNLPKIPTPAPEDSDQLKTGCKKQDGDELLCRGHIFNKISDYLYSLFTSKRFSKEIWKSLEYKYNTEKEDEDTYLIMKYFEFSMIDNSSITDQVHELQVLISKLKKWKFLKHYN